MKSITKSLKVLTVLLVLISTRNANAQSCLANFNTYIGANGLVSFTSTSANTTSLTIYSWNFGPATFSATGAAGMYPTYTYSTNGTFTVNLIIFNSVPSCSSSATAVITVTNAGFPCNLGASFQRTVGLNGQVMYTNISIGTVAGTTYTWSFGDGSTSSVVNPVHTYTANGFYVVTLVADNNFNYPCSGTVQVANTITNAPCSFSPSFTYSGSANGNVVFNNTTSNTNANTYYTWNFGDGSAANHQTNPSHIYTNGGTYTVCLTAANNSVAPTCSSTQCQTISVTNTCVANANFTLMQSATPQLWLAIPASTTNLAAVQWSWGDGSTSNTMFTSHQYSAAGMYTICLTVTLNCGSIATSCTSYSIFRSASSNNILTVNVVNANEVGIKQETKLDGKITVYPNPNNGILNVELSGIADGPTTIEVLSLVGEIILKSTDQTTNGMLNKRLDFSAMPKGIYFIRVSKDSQNFTQKISLQE